MIRPDFGGLRTRHIRLCTKLAFVTAVTVDIASSSEFPVFTALEASLRGHFLWHVGNRKDKGKSWFSCPFFLLPCWRGGRKNDVIYSISKPWESSSPSSVSSRYLGLSRRYSSISLRHITGVGLPRYGTPRACFVKQPNDRRHNFH